MQKLTREEIQALYDLGLEAVIDLLEQLTDTNEMLVQQVTALKIRVSELENQLAKDSHNSSKPPSSDGLKKQTTSLRQPSKRKVGGQRGRLGRTLKQVANPDHVVHYKVTCCSTCGHSLSETEPKAISKRQVFDIPAVRIEVTEHQAEIKQCPMCHATNKASFPNDITQPAQYGVRIKSQVVYLMNQHLLPYERTAEIMSDFYGQKISAGTLYSINQSCHELLKESMEQIRQHIIASVVAHFDESGLRVANCTQWLHSAGTDEWTYYTIHPKRGTAAMNEAAVLPVFVNIAVHDHWKPYFHYSCLHALCNSHHLRELTFIHEQLHQAWALDMKKLLLKIKEIVYQHQCRGKTGLARSQLESFEQRYEKIIAAGLKENPVSDSRRRRPKRSKALNLLIRLKQYRQQTLRFMYDFRVPFDNNLAERDIRMIKLQQKISGCFRIQLGAEMFCRIRSYISSAKKQDRNLLDALQLVFLNQPLFAH